MKAIYYADTTTSLFKGSNVVADDYALKANETFEDPSGKKEPAKLVNGSWVDATAEEHQQYIKDQVKTDNATQQLSGVNQAMNKLGLQVASLTAENKQLKQSVNQLGLHLAQLTMKDKKENGGN